MQMFNKFSTFRRKLTYAQARCLATCFSALIGLTSGITTSIIFNSLMPDLTILGLLLIAFFLSAALLVISSAFIFEPLFHVLYKRLDEENEKAKKQLIEELNLTKENYTKVSYSFEEILKDVRNKDVCLAILTNANYSVYVKLTYDPHHEKMHLS